MLGTLADASVDLIYVDPPFNTGKRQSRTRLRMTRARTGGGDRTGFAGRRYRSIPLGTLSFADLSPIVGIIAVYAAARVVNVILGQLH